ncbi:MAG: Na+/H+ antiporter subunit E [Oceanipulchritudo sp.]
MKASRFRKQAKGPFNSHFSMATWAVLLGLWIILSGKMDPFHLGVGVLAVIFINWQQTGLSPLRGEDEPGFQTIRLILYIPWLLWQMLLSSIYVAWIILRDPKGIDPRMISFSSRQPSLIHRVILANSITLTPGTLTVDLQEDRYLVHALTHRTAGEVLEGKLARKVARLSPKQPDATPVALETDSSEDMA